MSRPIENKVVISTRTPENDMSFNLLKTEGVHLLSFPMVETIPTFENISISKEILSSLDDIIFTSRNGVRYFFQYLHSHQLRKSVNDSTRFIVIGSSTAMEVSKQGISNTYINPGTTSEDLLEALINEKIENRRILLVLGNLASDLLEKNLSKNNNVSRITIYTTIPTVNHSPNTLRRIEHDEYDLIMCNSPSALQHLADLCEEVSAKVINLKVACIGETTKNKALSLGIIPKLTSSNPKSEVFVQEVIDYLEKVI